MKKKKLKEIINDQKQTVNNLAHSQEMNDVLRGLKDLRVEISDLDSFPIGTSNRQKERGFWISALGMGTLFATISFASNFKFLQSLYFLAAILTYSLSGLFAILAGEFFIVSFNTKKDLIERIKEIGSYKLIFGKRWRMQWRTGNMWQYRIALISDSFDYIFLRLALLFMIVFLLKAALTV